MKKLLLFLSIVCASIGAAHAETMYVVQGDLKYSVSLDSHRASLVEWLRDTAEVPVDVVIPDSVYYNEQSYPVTEIGARSFIMHGDLGAISLPNTLTRIGGAAFYGCRNLANVIIPDNVKSIRTAAFAGCSSLRNVVLGASLDSIEYAAFGGAALGAPAIDSITCLGAIPPVFTGQGIGIETDSLLLIDFFDSTVVENAILRVQPQNFAAYHQARGWREFRYLESILDGDAEYATVDGIRYELNDSLLTAAVVPLEDSIKYVGDIVIPEHFIYNDVTYTVTGIAEKAFAGSPRLTSVYLPNSVSIIDKDAFFECHQLSNIHLPENLERIGYAAFYQCGDKTEGIDTLIIPASCVYIDDFAFMFTPIRNLVIGDSVREIGHQAFMYMYLQNVVIGSSIERIGDHAFELAVGLNQFTCCAVTPPTLGKTVFATVQETMLDSVKQYWIDSLGVEFVPMQDRILYVPAGSVNWYRHSPQWQDFGTILPIQPEVATDHVIVDAEENEALFTWPTDTEAEKYIIDVRCDGEIFCHITLDGNGRLIGIAFAPARAPQSELPGAMSFMVTGLTEATRYTYTVAVLGEDDVVLHVYQGQFATNGYPYEFEQGGNEITPTPPIIPYDPLISAIDVQHTDKNAMLILIDGKIYLRTDGGFFSIIGQRIR